MILKKAEVGIGTLILLIALLIVVAIVSAILIQTNQTIGERIHKDSASSKKDISSHAIPLRLIGIGEGQGSLKHFEYEIRLAAGSAPIRLNDSIITIRTSDDSFSLNFRYNESFNCVYDPANGYVTYAPQELDNVQSFKGNFLDNIIIYYEGDFDLTLDLDGDGVYEKVLICSRGEGPCPYPYNGSYIQINLSSGGYLYAPMRNNDGSLAIFDNSGFNISYSPFDEAYIKGFRTGAISVDQITSVDPGIDFDIYMIPELLNFDLDEDGYLDYVGINDTHVIVYLSSEYENKDYYWTEVENAITIPLGVTLTAGSNTALNVNQDIIGSDGINYGNVFISGTSTGKIIGSNAVFRITPLKNGGYYCGQYLQKGPYYSYGLLQEGDVIKIKFENVYELYESITGSIIFIPPYGVETRTDFLTPNVININNYVLFP
jgi:archaellin